MMKPSMRWAPGLATLALFQGLVFAGSDPVQPGANDTAPERLPKVLVSAQADAAQLNDNDIVPLPKSTSEAQNAAGAGQNTQLYAQNAQSNLAAGNALGQQATTTIGSAAYGQMTASFQQYQNNMTMVVASQSDTKRDAAEYAHMMDEASQAAKSKDPAEQAHLFGNYLHDSRIFLSTHPDVTQLWVLRAVAALKLNKPATGAQAGQILSSLPPKDRDDPHIQKLLQVLGQYGWVAKAKAVSTSPSPGSPAPAAK
jgi:hypothetical protein